MLHSIEDALAFLWRGDDALWQIVRLSLHVSSISTLIAGTVAVPLALLITQHQFVGKRPIIAVINSLMAVPAVVIGLVVYLCLSRSGPLGFWDLLYSPSAMIIAQTLLACPLMTGLSIAAFQNVTLLTRETLVTLGANGWQIAWGMVCEARFALMAAMITGMARLIGETGMTMMVGGNIRGETRVMTTAIALETTKGNFELGIALGGVLLLVSIGINIILQIIQGRAGR